MNRFLMCVPALLLGGLVAADNVEDADTLLCAAQHVFVCFEDGDCRSAMPWELNVPDFVIVDVDKKILRTTKGSGENRSTTADVTFREDGRLFLSGHEYGRLFNIVVDESLGLMTATVTINGATISTFGACTDADRIGK